MIHPPEVAGAQDVTEVALHEKHHSARAVVCLNRPHCHHLPASTLAPASSSRPVAVQRNQGWYAHIEFRLRWAEARNGRTFMDMGGCQKKGQCGPDLNLWRGFAVIHEKQTN